MHESDLRPFTGTERFKVLRPLGTGGMGVVYAVQDLHLGTTVALKTLREKNPEALLRLKNEFRSLQDLRHPNLISFGELFKDQGHWFFTMELVDGTDLLSWVRKENRVSIGRLCDALRQLTYGLLALHATDRLHRDIKPENVMVEQSGRVVLMDFGLVTESVDSQQSHERFFPVGTSAYMSPEQAASKPLTPASDYYNMGVMLYKALTGEFPYSGTFASMVLQKQTTPAPDPALLAPDAPPELLQLCTELLALRPEDRPTGEEILTRLPETRSLSTPSRAAVAPTARETLFVGRSAEERILRDEYARFISEGAGAVLVHGASGLGKSELIRQFLHSVAKPDEDMVVLSGRCYEMETVSFKAFDPIVDALSQVLLQLPETEVFYVIPQNASLLLRLFPVLGRVQAMTRIGISDTIPQDPYELRELAFNALRELFCRLSDRRRIILFIDDIQWADADSHRLFRALFQDATPFPAFLLMGQRTESSAAEAQQSLSRTLETLPEGTRSVPVGPLSPEDSQALTRGLWKNLAGGGACSDEVIARIAREGQGHPLFLAELVQHSISNDTTAQEPARLDEALWARITGLPGTARQAIEVVSIAGAPLSLSVLAVMLKCTVGACMEIVNSLRVGHLVATRESGEDRRVDTYHDRVREAVLQRLPRTTRKGWHLRLAEGLEPRRNTPAELLAMHFELAQEHTKAAGYYQQAAVKAQAALAYNQEAAYLEKAIALFTMDLTIEIELLVPMREWYAQALAKAGRYEEAARVLLALLEERVGSDPPLLQRQAGDYLMRAGRLDEGIRVLENLLRAYKVRLPKHGWRLLLGLLWRRIRLRLRGLGFVERDASTISSEELARVDSFGAISTGTGWVDTIWAAHAQTLYVHSSLDLGEPGRVLHALCMEMIFVSGAGKGESAYQRKLNDKIHAISKGLKVPRFKAYVEVAKATMHFNQGRWGITAQHTGKAIAYLAEKGAIHYERALVQWLHHWTQFYTGDLNLMCAEIPGQYREAMERGDLLSASGYVLGLASIAHLNVEGPEEARARGEHLISQWSSRSFHFQHFWHLVSSAMIDLYCEEPEAAFAHLNGTYKDIKKAMLMFVPSVRTEFQYLRAKSGLALSRKSVDPRKDPACRLADKDGRRLIKSHRPYAHALGSLVQAESLRLQGHEEVARVEWRSAVEHLKNANMELFAAAAQYRFGLWVGGDEGNTLLTEARRFFHAQGVRDPEAFARMLAP